MKFSGRLLGGLLAVASTVNAAITLNLNSIGTSTYPLPQLLANKSRLYQAGIVNHRIWLGQVLHRQCNRQHPWHLARPILLVGSRSTFRHTDRLLVLHWR